MELLEICTNPSQLQPERHPKSNQVSDEGNHITIDSQHTMEDDGYLVPISSADHSHNSRIASPLLKKKSLQKNVIHPENEQLPTNTDQTNEADGMLHKKPPSHQVGFYICVQVSLIFFTIVMIAFVVVLTWRKPTAKSTATTSTQTSRTMTTETTTTTTSDTTATPSISPTSASSTTITTPANTDSTTIDTTITTSETTVPTSETATATMETTTSSSTSSTTSIVTSTTTTYVCSASAPSILANVTGTSTVPWTQYKYNYTATKPVPTLSFGISAPTYDTIYLDDISVVDIINSSVQLLHNPSFANSSTTATAWDIWCSSGCGVGNGGIVVNSSCRTDNCYKGRCSSTNTDYLIQPFPAAVGHLYTISFWYQRVKTFGFGGTSILSIGII